MKINGAEGGGRLITARGSNYFQSKANLSSLFLPQSSNQIKGRIKEEELHRLNKTQSDKTELTSKSNKKSLDSRCLWGEKELSNVLLSTPPPFNYNRKHIKKGNPKRCCDVFFFLLNVNHLSRVVRTLPESPPDSSSEPYSPQQVNGE